MARSIKPDDHHSFLESGLHIQSRTIYLELDEMSEDGEFEIGPKTVSRLYKNLHTLTLINQEPIRITMNSNGGSVTDGLAIYDIIRQNPCHITMTVLGAAQSMGAIILQAADYREAYPFTRLMLHDGSDGYAGHARDFEISAEEGRVLRLKMYEILAARTGKPKSYWARKLQRDYFMSAEQALAEGLIDRIIE